MTRAGTVAIGLGVFALSLAIRCLYAVDLAPVMYTRDQPGTRMATRYDTAALRMLAGDGLLYPSEIDPAKTGLLARPPGYPAFLRIVYACLGRSFFTAQLVQNVLNAVTPVLIALIGMRLFGPAVGVGGGALAAFSPHLGYASNLLSPDALSALPLAGASLLLARASFEKGPGPGRAAIAGALVGVSAWLRPNVVLMGPFLAVAIVALAQDRRAALRPALVLAATAGLTIVPITLRNYVVFGELVPISTNGGLTLWQGVADAGGERFGARTTDRRVAREEAARYHKPEYAQWWAEPDGIWRDHDRYHRSLEVIEQRPFWYARAMLRRMAAMVSYHSAEAPFVARVGGAERPISVADDEEGSQEGDLLAPLRIFQRSGAAARPPRIPDAVALAPGEWLAPLRPVVRGVQVVAAATTLPLAIVGILALLQRMPRAAGFVAVIPLYYLIFESMFIYEWRVATPMHGYLFLFAAAGAVCLFDLARRRVRPSP
jgi:Dolichyl-phosphate-mannose-protein mannosyltransferase